MVSAPNARLVPLTVNVAAAPEPEVPEVDAIRLAVPRDVLPAAKATVPTGALLPVACFTVAVSTVEAVCAIDAGLATITSEVAVAGAATETVAEAVELLKPVVAI